MEYHASIYSVLTHKRSTPRVSTKGIKHFFFLKVAMSHIKLKGMELKAPETFANTINIIS